MEGCYPIVCSGKAVGQVWVIRNSLYYQFRAQCSYGGDSVCRLMIRCGDVTMKIGIMVPVNGNFSLNKQIPVKHFKDENPTFFLPSEVEKEEEGTFIPIYADKPFLHLSQLQNAVFENRDGVMGAWIRGEIGNAGE